MAALFGCRLGSAVGELLKFLPVGLTDSIVAVYFIILMSFLVSLEVSGVRIIEFFASVFVVG